jgi:excisionase family DNA binding protein
MASAGAAQGREVLLLRYDGVAKRIGVSSRTFRALVYRGALPSVQIGRRRLISVRDVELFAEELRQAGRR